MLTAHQQEKMEELLLLILEKKEKRICLEGSAGVGKTYLVNVFLKELYIKLRASNMCRERCYFFITAPTHKALSVLKSKTDTENCGYTPVFKTVHSAMGLVRKRDFKTGEETFVKPKSSYRGPKTEDFNSAAVCVVDESSMLSEQLVNYLNEYKNTVIIFIGDRKQLPPVGEEISPVFSSDFPVVELTQIVRQGEGNPIIELSRNIHTILRPGAGKLVHREDGKKIGYLTTVNRDKILERLAESNGSDLVKYLAWTNDDVDSVNRKVREIIYGQPAKIENGETLVFTAPYAEFFTNQEIKVEKLEIKDLKVYHANRNSLFDKDGNLLYPSPKDGKNFYETTFFTCYLINDSIPVLHEASERQFQKALLELRKQAIETENWKGYYHLKEYFASLTYNHAITVHKSQGSTYKTAVIHVSNLNRNSNQSEKKKLFYTAVTRASELVVLYKSSGVI